MSRTQGRTERNERAESQAGVERRRRRESGAALVVAMLMLVMMAMIGVAALETVQVDQVVAGYQSRSRTALYAAEAGVAEGMANMQANGTPTVAASTLGDGGTHPYGLPSYGLSPGTTPELMGIKSVDGMNLAIGQGGTAKYSLEFWRFVVEGSEAGGTTARIEVAAGNFTGS